MTQPQCNGGQSRVVPNAPWQWMRANGLPDRIPDDAELLVDEQAGTITVEVFATDADGRVMLHGQHLMTRRVAYPMTVPPPPGLLDAYQHTVVQLRRRRDAAAAIRWETVEAIAKHLTTTANTILADRRFDDGARLAARGLLAAARVHIWQAVGLPEPEPSPEGIHTP